MATRGWGSFPDYKPASGVPHNLYRDYLYVRNLQPVQSGEVTEPAAYFIVGTPREVGTFPVTYTIVDSNGDTATVEFTITVFDPAPVPKLAISGGSRIVYEDETSPNTSQTKMYQVSLNTVGQEPVTVDFATKDGTARAGEDYSAISTTLTFAPGSQQQRIDVEIRSDAILEPPEKLPLFLP